MGTTQSCEVVGEHGTIVTLPKEGLVVMRVAHHVKRWIDASLWDRCFLWRHHTELMDRLADLIENPDKEVPGSLIARLERDVPAALINLAYEIAGEPRPREVYTSEPRSETDVTHWRYTSAVYALGWDRSLASFVTLGRWRANLLPRAEGDLAEIVRGADRRLEEHRATHGLHEGPVSLGEPMFVARRGSRLRVDKLLAAVHKRHPGTITAADKVVADYVEEYVIGHPLPGSWYSRMTGETPGNFWLDNVLAVVAPGQIQQRIILDHTDDPGINTPDVWTV